MTKKLIFSIDNASLIEENPNSNFAVLSMDFFASGKNLHDTWVSEETLDRTAETIKNCPIVWKYDPTLDDIFTHDKDEVPCGFVPESSVITKKKTPDGRTMLSVVTYIWKKYTGELLKFFKRDGGEKPISVEISVFNTAPLGNGLTEIKDYKYEAITLLGSFVTPAIPNANATVLSFSDVGKEYLEDYDREFLLKIPDSVKQNVSHGLELKKKYKKNIGSVEMSFAKTLLNGDNISRAQVTAMGRYFSENKKTTQGDTNPPSQENIVWLLFGGDEGKKWSTSILEELNREEVEIFEKEKDMGDVNNTIEEMSSEPTPQDVEKMSAEESKAEELKAEVEMAEPKEEKENISEEKLPADEKAELREEKKFEFPSDFSMEQMCKMFADDEDETIKMAKAEAEKGEFANPAVMLSGMFAKMCRMAELIEKMSKDGEAYMAENEELKKFKADVEAQQKAFAVKQTIEELSQKVVLTSEAKEEMALEAERYSLDKLDEWKTYCKAKSFDFSVRDGGESEVIRVGLPFTASAQTKKDDLWS